MQAPGWAIFRGRRCLYSSVECVSEGRVSLSGPGEGVPDDGGNRLRSATQPGHGFTGTGVKAALFLLRPTAPSGAAHPRSFRKSYRVKSPREGDRSARLCRPVWTDPGPAPMAELALRTGAATCRFPTPE